MFTKLFAFSLKMKMSPSFLEKWETLTEVLEPFSDKSIAQDPSSTNDIDKALAEIENQLKELVCQCGHLPHAHMHFIRLGL